MSRSGQSNQLVNFTITSSIIAVTLASCSFGPSRFEPPSISPSGAADRAMELYDKNGDGFLANDELDQVPGLKASMQTLDTNKDGKASEDEIAERIRTWQESQVGVTVAPFVVTMNGQPLTGATVTFEPESFLGDQFLVGGGRTDDMGMVSPRIPKEKRPKPDMPGGLQLGFYRVKISKIVNGKETIPARYNAETILGQEIALDDPALATHRARFDLK